MLELSSTASHMERVHTTGTNAIGTALFEGEPTLVHGPEHFMQANSFLTCSAAPIFDPRGNILGVLDVTGDRRAYHQHTMGLVRMSARMIENHWLSDEYNNRLRLCFHSRVEFIGTLLEGILIVGADGKLLAAKTDGELVLLRATPAAATVLARARPFRGTIRALPALAGGRLYVRDDTMLKCLDVGNAGR